MPVDEMPRRGRPPSGRKIVLQVALAEADHQAIEKLAERQKTTLSAMGREVMLKGLATFKGKGQRN